MTDVFIAAGLSDATSGDSTGYVINDSGKIVGFARMA